MPGINPAPARSGTSRPAGDPDAHHIVCCDETTALCGQDVSGEPRDESAEAESRLCPLCAWAEDEDLPCTVPGCPNGAAS